MRQGHRPDERLFVDWAGDTIALRDPHSGGVQSASLFVAVLGTSNYTYAEATTDQTLPNWIGAHIRAFEFFGGVPQLKTGTENRKPKTGENRENRGQTGRFLLFWLAVARLARVIAVDVPHHVTQRGNARQFILNSDADRRVYLDLLRQYAQLHQVSFQLIPQKGGRPGKQAVDKRQGALVFDP
jgi:hypothetical protein